MYQYLLIISVHFDHSLYYESVDEMNYNRSPSNFSQSETRDEATVISSIWEKLSVIGLLTAD